MKTKLLILLLLMAVSATTHATLISRAGGTMIYDDVLNITWLQDANYVQTSGFDTDGHMKWFEAMDWADGLSFGGFDDWRLPGFTGETRCSGPNCVDSELGHMFYNNIGATAGNSILTGSNRANLALFENIQDASYWSGVKYTPDPNDDLALAWDFTFPSGFQGMSSWGNNRLHAWAVRSGDVTSVPVPATIWLFGSALIGLVRLNRRQ